MRTLSLPYKVAVKVKACYSEEKNKNKNPSPLIQLNVEINITVSPSLSVTANFISTIEKYAVISFLSKTAAKTEIETKVKA